MKQCGAAEDKIKSHFHNSEVFTSKAAVEGQSQSTSCCLCFHQHIFSKELEGSLSHFESFLSKTQLQPWKARVYPSRCLQQPVQCPAYRLHIVRFPKDGRHRRSEIFSLGKRNTQCCTMTIDAGTQV